MVLVLEDRYESCISIDTKKVPVVLHLTSQWRFSDIRVTKNWILRILDENRPNFKFSPKILGICDFEDAPAKQAFAEGIRKVKRPRGIPKTTWLGAVQKELHELNLTLENAKEIAQERQKWTDIVDDAMSNNWRKTSMMMMMIRFWWGFWLIVKGNDH